MKMTTFDFSPPVIAHRGASAYSPENTMSAFVKAAQLGIKWVEFDVVLAKCGTPIIFHDETLERTSNFTGEIDAYTYTQLQSADAGRWFHPHFSNERIPTLRQVLMFLREANMCANVEIKPMPGKEEVTVKNTLAVIGELGAEVPIMLFSSFSIPTLRHLRQYAPDAPIGLLLEHWEAGWQDICTELNCVSIHTDEAIIDAKSADLVKKMDRYLLCYTVNRADRAKQLFSYGVDAVFSDCPDVIERELIQCQK